MLDWAFTPQCAACATPADPPFCDACRLSLVEADGRDVIAPIRVVTPWRFGGALAIAIRRLKFSARTHVARDLAPLWAPVLAAIAEQDPDSMVVPIPLHWRRRFLRGFDQTWMLAGYACRAASIAPPIAALHRTRYTPPQSVLARAARSVNLMGVFAADPAIVGGRDIILVDDVVTTGATLSAATHALYRANAKSVIGLAIARTA